MGDAFIEVFVDIDISVCESRDSKGLYAQARAGNLKSFTGIDHPYEMPLAPQVRLADPLCTPAANAQTVVKVLTARGFLT